MPAQNDDCSHDLKKELASINTLTAQQNVFVPFFLLSILHRTIEDGKRKEIRKLFGTAAAEAVFSAAFAYNYSKACVYYYCVLFVSLFPAF